ncbi:MAG: ACP S-malonyltransferase [Candidatus Thiodiazotropha sp.]
MTAYMFPGQGSQFSGMGADYFDKYPELVEEADEILGYSIKALCTGQNDARLDNTEFTQPALYTVNALTYMELMQTSDVQPEVLLGHSLGEYSALYASGAISFGEGLELVRQRGLLMSNSPEGAMAAIIGANEQEIEEILKRNELTQIDIANYNCRTQIVISGPVEQIKASEAHLSECANFIPLRTSGAFHSRQMLKASRLFSDVLLSCEFKDCKIPVIANVTGRPYESGRVAELLGQQVASSVHWYHSIVYLLHSRINSLVEVGPGDVLSRMLSTIQREYKAGMFDDLIATFELEQCASEVDSRGNEIGNILSEIHPVNSADLVQRWNMDISVGDKVVRRSDGEMLRTRSEAILLFGSKPVVYLRGYKGYFDLSELEVV